MTVKELKAELDRFPDNARCYAYEGEATGIVLLDPNGEFIGLIECPQIKEKAL